MSNNVYQKQILFIYSFELKMYRSFKQHQQSFVNSLKKSVRSNQFQNPGGPLIAWHTGQTYIVNRPGVAGAVLQTAS